MAAADPAPQSFGDRFEAIAVAALAVQTACREATSALLDPDASVRRVGKRLDLRTNLAWKLVRILHAEDAAAIIAVIPGDRGCDALVEAIRVRQADPRAADAVQAAFDRYRETREGLGIESRELAIMAGGGLNDPATTRQIEAAARRVMEGYAELRGHRIELMVVGALAFPSVETPGGIDIVGYELCHGVTRLRPGGPIRLRNAAWARDSHEVQRDADDGGLVPEASTDDLSAGEILVARDGNQSAVYVDPRSDRTEPVTVAFLQVYRNLGPMYRDPNGPDRRRLGYQANCSPVRQVVVEYHQPRSLPAIIDPTATADFAFTQGATLEWKVPYDRIPFALEVEESSSVILPAAYGSARAYHRALVEAAAARTGHDLEAFVGHRVCHEHLPMSSSLSLSWSPPVQS